MIQGRNHEWLRQMLEQCYVLPEEEAKGILDRILEKLIRIGLQKSKENKYSE